MKDIFWALRCLLPFAFRTALMVAGISIAGHAASPARPARKLVGEPEEGGVLVTTNQMITPIGKLQRIDGARPKDMALSPDGQTLAVLTTSKVLFYEVDGTSKGSVPVKPGPLGLAWQPDGQALYASGEDGAVYQITREGTDWKATTFRAIEAMKVKKFTPSDLSPPSAAKEAPAPRRKNDPQVAGLAVSPDGQRLYAALGINNEVAVVDLTTKQNLALIPTGIAPYRIALSPDGKTLYSPTAEAAPRRRARPVRRQPARRCGSIRRPMQRCAGVSRSSTRKSSPVWKSMRAASLPISLSLATARRSTSPIPMRTPSASLTPPSGSFARAFRCGPSRIPALGRFPMRSLYPPMANRSM